MAVILDSDSLSILQRQSGDACENLERRLSQLADEDVFTTIITFEEQMRGWLAVVHGARTDRKLLLGYSELHSMLHDFCRLNILPFDAAAQYATGGHTGRDVACPCDTCQPPRPVRPRNRTCTKNKLCPDWRLLPRTPVFLSFRGSTYAT